MRLGYTSTSPTDVACQWNSCFTKSVEPLPIHQIHFYKEEAKDKIRKKGSSLKRPPPASTPHDQQRLLDGLSSLNSKIVGLSLFRQYTDPFISTQKPRNTNMPHPLPGLFKQEYINLAGPNLQEKCDETFKSMQLTQEERGLVEKNTRAQAASSFWHEQRVGRLTASSAHTAIRANINSPPKSLVTSVCSTAVNRPLNVPSINWGREHEAQAFNVYSAFMTKTNIDAVPSGQIYYDKQSLNHGVANTSRSGLLIDSERPYLGASPDGKVSCQCCGEGVVEIKCPFSLRDKPLREALEENKFYINKELHLNQNHPYYTQIQMQMHVARVEYADFFVWTPIDCILTRVDRDDVYIGDMIKKLETFWKRCILPELLTRKLQREGVCAVYTSPVVAADTLGQRTYCVCKTTEDNENMVACDRCDQWFHPRCLKLKRLPQSKTWYCPKCRKEKRKL